MKRLFVLMAIVFILPLIGSADVILNAGDSFVFDFTAEDFTYRYDVATPPPLSLPVQFGFGVTRLSVEPPTIRLSLYHAGSEVPFRVETNYYTLSFPVPEEDRRLVVFGSTNYWPTFTGSMKLESLETPVRLNWMSAGTIIDGEYYSASIPEPNSVVLLLVGSGVFYLRKKVRFPTKHSTLR